MTGCDLFIVIERANRTCLSCTQLASRWMIVCFDAPPPPAIQVTSYLSCGNCMPTLCRMSPINVPTHRAISRGHLCLLPRWLLSNETMRMLLMPSGGFVSHNIKCMRRTPDCRDCGLRCGQFDKQNLYLLTLCCFHVDYSVSWFTRPITRVDSCYHPMSLLRLR